MPHLQAIPQPTPLQSAVQAWQLHGPVNAVTWLSNTTAVAAGADDHAWLLRPGLTTPVAVNVAGAGASTTSSTAILTLQAGLVANEPGAWLGTDTGHVAWLAATGELLPLAHFKGQFIEHLAYEPRSQTLAVAVGRKVHLLDAATGAPKQILENFPSTVAGLTVNPTAARLAVAHYNGVTIHALDNPKATPRQLEWAGAHAALTYSPDGKWLISALQEQAIHLWRLADALDLQMRGYPGKITQFAWSADGAFLTTNGGTGLPLWNFTNKLKGPAGSQAEVVADLNPEQLTTEPLLVAAVATHPAGPFAAIGYTNGLLLLAGLKPGSPLVPLKAPAETPTPDDALTALAWSPDGLSLIAGSANGWLGLIDFRHLATSF